MTAVLHLLCAGAAQGLVQSLQPDFEGAGPCRLQARFGAVGAMQELLRSGKPCDVFVATDAMVGALQSSGELRAQPRAVVGVVRAAVAVPSGQAAPDVATPQALRASLLAATALYMPDAIRSTAGAHFAGVLDQLGIRDAVAPKLRQFPNGAAAMRELAAQALPGALGCTQVSEILYTEGVQLVGALPEGCTLATVYVAAIARQAREPALALRFIEWLTAASYQAVRQKAGFESDRRGA